MEPKDRLRELKLDNLPAILHFNDEATPLLIETRQRIIETARQRGADKAEAVASTYEKLAEELLVEQLDESRRPVADNYVNKAREGLLINMARIWRDAGAVDKCLEALDRAIKFAKHNRWASVVTALEIERGKLLPAVSAGGL